MIWTAIWAGAQLWAGAQEAENIRAMGRLKEKIADFNADLAEQDAFNAEASGATEMARYQTTIDQVVGAQRVAMASQGTDINFGTAKELQAETRLTGLMNQFDMQRRGHERAKGYKREASNIRFGAQMGRNQTEAEAGLAVSEGALNAANSMVSGYGKYSNGGFLSKNDLTKEYRKGNLAADSGWNAWTRELTGDDFWTRNPYRVR